MCRKGDIILINAYDDPNGEPVGKHPFIVIDDEGGEISGLEFDFVASVMSSFKNDKHREKKLRFEENLEITVDDGVKKPGFIKTDQLHYFKKDKIDYFVVGSVTPELFNELVKLVVKWISEEKQLVNVNNL